MFVYHSDFNDKSTDDNNVLHNKPKNWGAQVKVWALVISLCWRRQVKHLPRGSTLCLCDVSTQNSNTNGRPSQSGRSLSGSLYDSELTYVPFNVKKKKKGDMCFCGWIHQSTRIATVRFAVHVSPFVLFSIAARKSRPNIAIMSGWGLKLYSCW